MDVQRVDEVLERQLLQSDSDFGSFEIVRETWSDSETAAFDQNSEIPDTCPEKSFLEEEESSKSIHYNSLSPTTSTLTQEAASADLKYYRKSDLEELISEYEAPSSSEQEDLTNPNPIMDVQADLLLDCLQKSKESLKYSQQQQTLLKSLVEDRAAAGKTTLPQNRCHTSGKSSDHSSSEGFQPSPSKMSKPKVYLRVKESQVSAFNKSLQTFNKYLELFDSKLSLIPSKMTMAIVVSCILAVFLISSYSLIYFSGKSGKIQESIEAYANMSQGERRLKEVYQVKSEDYRESILHKTQGEVRETINILQKCQNDLASSKTKYSELSTVLKTTEIKLNNVLTIANDLRKKNQELHAELHKIRTLKDRYDYTVLGGLLLCLIIIMFLHLRPKK